MIEIQKFPGTRNRGAEPDCVATIPAIYLFDVPILKTFRTHNNARSKKFPELDELKKIATGEILQGRSINENQLYELAPPKAKRYPSYCSKALKAVQRRNPRLVLEIIDGVLTLHWGEI